MNEKEIEIGALKVSYASKALLTNSVNAMKRTPQFTRQKQIRSLDDTFVPQLAERLTNTWLIPIDPRTIEVTITNGNGFINYFVHLLATDLICS